MIVNISGNATEEEINRVIQRIREAGFQPHVTRGTERTIVAAVGSRGHRHEIEALARFLRAGGRNLAMLIGWRIELLSMGDECTDIRNFLRSSTGPQRPEAKLPM